MVKVKIRDDLKTAGDCPDFAESSEQNGTVPLSGVVLRWFLSGKYPKSDPTARVFVQNVAPRQHRRRIRPLDTPIPPGGFPKRAPMFYGPFPTE